jgi:hypothetical protein
VFIKVTRLPLVFILTAAIVAVWTYAFRAPLTNILAGPMNGALSAILILVAFPGLRGPRVKLGSLAVYGSALLGTAEAIATGILPWPYHYLPGFSGLFFGVHGEGLLGIPGIVVGGVVAGTVVRRKGPPNKPLTVLPHGHRSIIERPGVRGRPAG